MFNFFSCFNLATGTSESLHRENQAHFPLPCLGSNQVSLNADKKKQAGQARRIVEFKQRTRPSHDDDEFYEEDLLANLGEEGGTEIHVLEDEWPTRPLSNLRDNLTFTNKGEEMARQADRAQKLKELEEEKEKNKLFEAKRLEEERGRREEREKRIRSARDKSADDRRRKREEEDKAEKQKKMQTATEKAAAKLLADIEGHWSILLEVEGENETQELTFPVADIKNGVLTWAPRMKREGSFEVGFERGGVVTVVAEDKLVRGTLECPPSGAASVSGHDDSRKCAGSQSWKLRWSNGDIWLKTSENEDTWLKTSKKSDDENLKLV